jgi:hypothetical protein
VPGWCACGWTRATPTRCGRLWRRRAGFERSWQRGWCGNAGLCVSSSRDAVPCVRVRWMCGRCAARCNMHDGRLCLLRAVCRGAWLGLCLAAMAGWCT